MQISSAWLGPESAATRAGLPTQLATTSLMSRPLPRSMPFVSTRSGSSGATYGAAFSQVPRKNAEGTANTAASAPSKASAIELVARTLAGNS